MISLNNNPPNPDQDDSDIIDLSMLDASDDFGIDKGVTSGADSNTWDEINVDKDGRSDGCEDNGSSGQSADHPGAAVCKESQSKKNQQTKP